MAMAGSLQRHRPTPCCGATSPTNSPSILGETGCMSRSRKTPIRDRTMTHEQHALRAALMGRVYDWRDGTYCVVGTLQHASTQYPMAAGAIDAITLEPVPAETLSYRSRTWGMTGYSWKSVPLPTPYCDE